MTNHDKRNDDPASIPQDLTWLTIPLAIFLWILVFAAARLSIDYALWGVSP